MTTLSTSFSNEQSTHGPEIYIYICMYYEIKSQVTENTIMAVVERVQSLSLEGMNEVPKQFIRPESERPENTKAAEGVAVPVISLSQPRDLVVKEVAEAAAKWGFFMATDHGISPSLIRRLQEVGSLFFELPQVEKEVYANDPSCGKFEGYGTKMTKNHEEKVEWIDYFFHLLAPPTKVNHQFWPRNPPTYREVNEEYGKEVMRVTEDVLELLSEGLGLERKALKRSLGNEEIEMEMKVNMYPPCPQPELALGVEPHTDMSALTLLVSDQVDGLQIWNDAHNWVAVDYLPDSLFIHVGDQLEVLSNGKYKSVLHRSLVSKEKRRMSWAVFFVPPHETVIGPQPELVDHKNPAKYSTKTFAEYRYRKFNKLPQ